MVDDIYKRKSICLDLQTIRNTTIHKLEKIEK